MILVTGGAGYIGSHMVKHLLDFGYNVVVLDNLSTGHRFAVDQRASFHQGDLRDEACLSCIFSTYPISAVIHFAGSCYVAESVANPLKYYENNLLGSIALLKQMSTHNVKYIVFSSSCAVYGAPEVEKIDETVATKPINPYGVSKLMIERMIRDLSKASELKFIILRYFNVAGADPSGTIGEYHIPEPHLVPNILYCLLEKRKEFFIYGADYNTFDGTCIRDFVHVNDLTKAHILALQSLGAKELSNETYNLGSETGYSVMEVIKMCEIVAAKKVNVIRLDKRKGDPARLIASSNKIKAALGWQPKYSLKEIIETAWKWHSTSPKGYDPS